MNKFYGGGGVEGHAGRCCTAVARQSPTSSRGPHGNPTHESQIAGRRERQKHNAISRNQALPTSTYHGPSREGVSGERVPPDSGSTQPFDEREYAEQMRCGFAFKYGLTPEAD